ncbi:MAG: phosphatidate cytidylyltransferase [Treponema sp.]|jgi:phosphatidate cytidylyltransferase|nr:phosphatidate cytidylyltransferase [Treponema sp.]
MNTSIQRLLLFAITLPLAAAMILLVPYRNHLIVNISAVVLSALGSMEFGMLLQKRGRAVHPLEALALGSLAPLGITLQVSFGVHPALFPALLAAGAAWPLISPVFSPAGAFKDAIHAMAAGFSTLIYPGLFMLWIIRMAQFAHAGIIILVFLLMVVGNDSSAWAAGMLFGKGNRGIIPVSPNKSLAGFIGGMFTALLVGAAAVFLTPQAFVCKKIPSLAAGILLGAGSGIAANLGDLAESVMKRSVDVKDSGFIVPGRGGILDSIDSIAFASPVFYGLYWFFFA